MATQFVGDVDGGGDESGTSGSDMADNWQRPSGQLAWLAGLPLAIWLAVTRAAGGAPPPPPVTTAPVATTAPSAQPPLPSVAAQEFAAEQGPSALCLSRFLDPIYAMAGAPAPPIPAGAVQDWRERIETASERLLATFGTVSVDSLIATLPDPIDSGLTYAFESGLQAVRRGVERGAGDAYYRDRSWLPWDDREGEPAKPRELEACRASMPGLMLFRGGNAADAKLFLVLLVGESPTTGLRQLAMRRALYANDRFATPWDGVDGYPEGARTVRIVGPTFSASAQSLRTALRSWADENPRLNIDYQVVSGTATGPAVQDWLGGKNSKLSDTSTIAYRATTVPSAMVECSYLRFLNSQLGVDPESGEDPAANTDTRKSKRLEGVATLSESGTEFGATSGDRSGSSPFKCPWLPSSSYHFPFHISALRDAYEKLDKSAPAKESVVSRAISLDASLQESRVALDVEGSPSQKASTAEDLSLGNVLQFVSTRRIRHLAIRATDIGDAIFLARRIRDVAPDVRLAFFDSDVLLLHPSFRRQLVGSLIVTPYPFLGLTELRSDPGQAISLDGFVSGNAQGLYNAAIAQRSMGIESDLLSGYEVGSTSPLPIWVAAVGRGAMVPLKVTPTADCTEVLYGTTRDDDKSLKEFCLKREAQGGAARSGENSANKSEKPPWEEFRDKHSAALHLPASNRLPYSWKLLFAALCFGLVVDLAFQNRQGRRFWQKPFPANMLATQQDLDRSLDLAIGRAKWRLYSAIRSFLFFLAFAYMGVVYLLSVLARDGHALHLRDEQSWRSFAHDLVFVGLSGVAVAMIGYSGYFTWTAITRFFRDFRAFAACVGSTMTLRGKEDVTDAVRESRASGPDPVRSDAPPPMMPREEPTVSKVDSTPPSSLRFGERLSLTFGVAHPAGQQVTAKVSFAQLRLLTWASLVIAGVFGALFVADVYVSADLGCLLGCDGADRENSWSRLALHALHNADLSNGVSPAVPALFCMACTYVWAVGRMARLALAHSTSRIAPPDGETDLVSTPIRMILHPGYAKGGIDADAGFTHVERNVVNSIWRPITGSYYVAAAVGLAFFPLVLFALKPPSTLSGAFGTAFLSGGLALCVYLIGITIVQLLQYWLSLKKLLKRILEHPLGPAFSSVPDFARDSVDHQVSRLPDEELRWSACAQQFCDLVREVSAIEAVGELEDARKALFADHGGASAAKLTRLRQAALARAQRAPRALGAGESDEGHHISARTKAEAELGEEVIRLASRVTALLETPWNAVAVRKQQSKTQPAAAQITGELAVTWRAASGSDTPFAAEPEAASRGDDETPPQGTRALERGSGQFAALGTPNAIGRLTASSVPPPAEPQDGPSRGALDGGDAKPIDALSSGSSAYTAAEMAWLRRAQTFVATVVTLLVHRHVRQFRYFVHVTTGCGLLLLLAVANYPFEPYRLLMTFMWIVMLTVVGSSLWVFIQLDRNTLISLISGTPPQVTFNGALMLRVLAWAIVPLLSVAAAQYPEVADSLYQLLTPFQHALR